MAEITKEQERPPTVVITDLTQDNKRSLCQNNRATTTRHDYSRWRRPGNLKAKASFFEIHFFRIQTLSLKNVWAILIVNIMVCGLKLFCSFSEGSFNIQKQRLCTPCACVLHFGTSLCRPRPENEVNWPIWGCVEDMRNWQNIFDFLPK